MTAVTKLSDDLVRCFDATIADREVASAEGSIPAVSVKIDSHVFSHESFRTVGIGRLLESDTQLTLTAPEIDHLIARLTIARNLLGEDFLIYGHVNQYTLNGQQFTFDGTEVPEE